MIAIVGMILYGHIKVVDTKRSSGEEVQDCLDSCLPGVILIFVFVFVVFLGNLPSPPMCCAAGQRGCETDGTETLNLNETETFAFIILAMLTISVSRHTLPTLSGDLCEQKLSPDKAVDEETAIRRSPQTQNI